ncbi:hypothetical protein LTR78_009785 [Recurvomyces mirabilis]|uniref:Uncharacterized protein n=1 Tax=Recurvomyces mirabilis TaxID=574656 RepID=A0AAE0TQZ0_9PEZI|nr:hypothetical protein LTR78_009785 [Recurvomyces mirabilis]KAK5158202.1 hypothetical protein LTS14_003220 [Recurvomyces mirabilis]
MDLLDTFLVRPFSQHLDYFTRLWPALYLQTIALYAVITVTMFATSQAAVNLRSPPPPSPTNTKLLVIRFLDAHHASGAIDTKTHAMLYRMVVLISAMGKDLHSIIQSKSAHVSVIHRMGQHAGFVVEGCVVLKRHYGMRADRAEAIGEQLDGLAKVLRGTQEEKMMIMQPDALLRFFRHLATHFYDAVYGEFLQLHHVQPECPGWSVNGKLLAIQEAIDTIYEISQSADEVTQGIENKYGRLSKAREASLATRSSPRKDRKPDLTVDIAKAKTPKTLPIMSVLDGPPVLPPLPFQIPEVDEPVQQSAPAVVRINKHLIFPYKSFSAVEDQVSQRGHARSATVSSTGYVADQSATGLGISNLEPRQVPNTAGRLSQRKPSTGNVPRVFKGSLSELQADVERLGLNKVKTPEGQHASPKPKSPPHEDFTEPEDYYRGHSAGLSSTFPSPATVLQRREAFMSKDTQWESRLVDGEVIRSRRPSDRLQVSRATLVSAQSAEVEDYSSDQSTPKASRANAGGTATNRGPMRQRENTM